MKLYEKTIDNKLCILPINKIVVVKDGIQYFSPTVEMIYADGWIEHVPVINNTTEEEMLQMVRIALIDEVLNYDSSEEVNIFYVSGIPVWLDKATRAGLMLRLQAESAIGLTETSLWYNSMCFRLPIDLAIQMLYTIEVYASNCYDNTQSHISTINGINTIEELEDYNYKIGYPEKLNFSF